MTIFTDARLLSDAKQLKFSDFRSIRRTKDIQSHLRSGPGREGVDSFMADRVAGEDCLPAGAVPSFDPEGLNMLAVVQPLHDQGVVESYGLGKINFQQGVVRTHWRRPKRIWIIVQGILGFVCMEYMPSCSEIYSITFRDGGSEFFQPFYVLLGQQALT
jgi:hypothetical protein